MQEAAGARVRFRSGCHPCDSGAVGVDFVPGSAVIDYEYAYERAQESIRKLVPYAESAGVAIAIENVWNKFLLSPLELRTFIDEIGSDYVGSYFDVGNVVHNGYPEHWIRILGERIKKSISKITADRQADCTDLSTCWQETLIIRPLLKRCA